MADSKTILEFLDRANESVSEWFGKYCLENNLTPKAVCVSVKARGIKEHFVCQLFSGNLPPCASPRGGGAGGGNRQARAERMGERKPTAKKPARK